MGSPRYTQVVLFFHLILAVLLGTGFKGKQINDLGSESVAFTWVANTTWLIEAEGMRILSDAAITRIDFPPFDLSQPESLRFPSVNSDTLLVKNVLHVLGADSEISYIVVGHGHVDHTIDLGLIAQLTGAHILGSRTVCLQAQAQGVSSEQCTIVEGGEVVPLNPGLEVRVVRWSHSGDPSDPRFRLIQVPLELIEVPEVDPFTGGIDMSVDGGYPNGGGVRAFLFKLETMGGDLRWLVSNSGNPYTFDGEASTTPDFFEDLGLSMDNLEIVYAEGTPRSWLSGAVEEEGIEKIDLWIGYGSSGHVQQVMDLLPSAVFIPHHWGGFGGQYSVGVPRAYTNTVLEEHLNDIGIKYLPQVQYLEKYRLSLGRIERVPNTKAKTQLGLPLEPVVH